jgi:hypothetical protein
VSCSGAPSVRRRRGCPLHRPRRAPGPCRIAGRPAVAAPTVAHLAVSPLPVRVVSSDRLSPIGSPTLPRLPRLLERGDRPGTPCRTSLPDPRPLPLVALRADARPPGSSSIRVVPSTSVTWRSVHAPAGFRVFLHRRVRVPRRRCRRRLTRSFLGFDSPSRRCLHCRWCPRSPEDPIPRPVCVFAAFSSPRTRRTADRVCPVVGAATVAGHGLPGVFDVKELLLRT